MLVVSACLRACVRARVSFIKGNRDYSSRTGQGECRRCGGTGHLNQPVRTGTLQPIREKAQLGQLGTETYLVSGQRNKILHSLRDTFAEQTNNHATLGLSTNGDIKVNLHQTPSPCKVSSIQKEGKDLWEATITLSVTFGPFFAPRTTWRAQNPSNSRHKALQAMTSAVWRLNVRRARGTDSKTTG